MDTIKTSLKAPVALAVVLLACAAAPALASSVVSVPPSLAVPPAGDVVVPVTISPSDGVLALDLRVGYDPAVLTPTGVFTTGYASGFEINWSVPEPGTVALSIFGATPLSGSGEVAWILFHAAGTAGSSSAVTLTQHDLNEGNIPSTASNGTISVTSSATITMPDDANGESGLSLAVPVTANLPAGSLSLDLDLRWNPLVLQATAVTPSNLPPG